MLFLILGVLGRVVFTLCIGSICYRLCRFSHRSLFSPSSETKSSRSGWQRWGEGGPVESCLPGFQMVPASCVSVRGEKSPCLFSPLYLLKVSWFFRVKIQFLGPRLTSLHLYRPVFKHSHSGDKGFRMWMPGETTECIAWGLALWSQTARVANNLGQIICSPCVSVSCTLKVKILCVAFYVE